MNLEPRSEQSEDSDASSETTGSIATVTLSAGNWVVMIGVIILCAVILGAVAWKYTLHTSEVLGSLRGEMNAVNKKTDQIQTSLDRLLDHLLAHPLPGLPQKQELKGAEKTQAATSVR